MNIPNLITLFRIPILFVIVALMWFGNDAELAKLNHAPFIFQWAATASFILFILAGISDWLDGYLARKLNQVSDYGKLMDALSDKVLTVGLFVALYGFGLIPQWGLWALLLIITREFLITGLRLVAAGKGIVLAAEKSGKIKTTLQIIAIGTLLLNLTLRCDFPATPQNWITFVQQTGWVAFGLATLLTVWSGSIYVCKYWDLFTGADS